MALSYNSSLDTNLLVRLAIGDIPEQRQKVLDLLNKHPDQTFYICDVVVAETIYVLGSNYEQTREEIREFFQGLFSVGNIHPESPYILDVLDFFVDHPALSFVDCYSAAHAEAVKK